MRTQGNGATLRVLALALLLVSATLAGCLRTNPTDGGSQDATPITSDDDHTGSQGDGSPQDTMSVGERWEAWRAQAADRGPGGLPATLDLHGTPMVLAGNLTAAVETPFELDIAPLFPADAPYLYVPEATVQGHGQGLLVLQGHRLQATAGTLEAAPVDNATITADHVRLRLAHDPTREPPVAQPGFPEAWQDANRSLFFADGHRLTLASLTLSGYDRAVLLQADGHRPLEGPLTVTADGLLWDRASSLQATEATVTTGRFALGGNVTAGSVQPAERDPVPAPGGVFGDRATVVLTPGHAESQGTFRFTQGLTKDGPVLEARVELLPEGRAVTLAQGTEAWVKVHYREASFEGDAILAAVATTGSGAEMITLPVARPPNLIEQWFAILDETGYATPFFAIGVVGASPAVVLAQAMLCGLLGCPDQSPYPAWMEAGETGVFYYRVNASMAPGTYEASLHVEGENHGELVLPVTITVEPAVPE